MVIKVNEFGDILVLEGTYSIVTVPTSNNSGGYKVLVRYIAGSQEDELLRSNDPEVCRELVSLMCNALKANLAFVDIPEWVESKGTRKK